MKVIIIGGVAGGATAAARLRRLDENAEIILLERGEYISFANCGLPYYIGGVIKEKSALTLQTPQTFNARFKVDVRINSEAISINTDKKTVSIKNAEKTYEESYDKLILSMGAKPINPNWCDGAFTLRSIPDTYKIDEFIKNKKPKTAAIIGGGYIGLEMAENLMHKGIDTTIVEMAPSLIASLDGDMSSDFMQYAKNHGLKIMCNTSVYDVKDENGLININDGLLKVDMLIIAIGVSPESDIAKSAGISINNRGAIITNENMQTSNKDIYAVGDAIEITEFITKQKSYIPLAGPANKQGRIAADNICGISSKYAGTQGSAILKFNDLTVASTGINERTAIANSIDYDKIHTYSANHAGYYPDANFMNIKTIFEKNTGKILGAQLIGFDGVDKRCDVLATAIRAKMTAKDLTELELCYAPPFSSAKDPVNMIGYVIENILSGKIKSAHWHDMEKWQNNANLLDVRNKDELSMGLVSGFINIPLDDLRDNIQKLDKTKPVYVHCYSGLRSYIACRILIGNGFDVYNISGGYRLYDLNK